MPIKQKVENKNYVMYALIVLLVIAAFVIGTLYTKVTVLEKGGGTNTAGTTGTNPSAAPRAELSIVGDDPVLGDKNAKVTVYTFEDFQCPFCGAFSGLDAEMVQNMKSRDATWEPAELGIKDNYVKSGKVKLVWKDYPFLGQESLWSAAAARCAQDQGKFWEYHDYLFSHQKGENQGQFSKDNLKKFAADMQLDTKAFNDCVDTDKYAKKIQDSLAYGQNVGVNGTPATFINTSQNLISGAAPFSEFKTAIDQELKK